MCQVPYAAEYMLKAPVALGIKNTELCPRNLIKGDLGALMAMIMDVTVFCDVMSCSPVFVYQTARPHIPEDNNP